MAHICGECTYLDLSSGDIYGKFNCEKKYERHLATDVECSRYCTAYSRNLKSISNAIDFSKDHTSSSCYLTTMLCKILKLEDDNECLNKMRNFRANVLQKDQNYKPLLVEYDIIGPKIAEALYSDPINTTIAKFFFSKYVLPIIKLIDNNENEKAVNLYIRMTNELKNIYHLDNIYISELQIENADLKNSGHGIYKTKKITY